MLLFHRKQVNHVAYFAGMLLVLAVAATSFAVHSRYSVLEETAVGKNQVQAKQLAVHSQLDDEPTEPSADTGSITEQQDAFVAEVEAIFGWHFVFLSLVLLGTILLWVYVRCIRPQSWFRDFQKPFVSASAGFGTAATGTTAHLDENDLPGSLTLVPGEAVFFNEELALSFGGAFGSCSKLSVTNLRVIAQKSDTIFCGTCSVCFFYIILHEIWFCVPLLSLMGSMTWMYQIGAYEDAWPIGNVSKVSHRFKPAEPSSPHHLKSSPTPPLPGIFVDASSSRIKRLGN